MKTITDYSYDYLHRENDVFYKVMLPHERVFVQDAFRAGMERALAFNNIAKDGLPDIDEPVLWRRDIDDYMFIWDIDKDEDPQDFLEKSKATEWRPLYIFD